MRSILLLATLALSGNILLAQTYQNTFDHWEKIPSRLQVNPDFAKESAVILSDQRFQEFRFEKEEIWQYRTYHRRIRVLDDKGIEIFNKIYLPVASKADVLNVKARTILPDGTVKDLPASNMKEITGEDGDRQIIFAMEGMVKGCDVEYSFSVKRDANFFGGEVFQGGLPVQYAQFMLITPEHLQFELKPYNGISPARDSVASDKRNLYISRTNNIKGVEDEKYSVYNISLARIDFKLSYNRASSNNVRLFTWNELAKRIYSIYTDIPDNERKKVRDLMKKIGNLPADEKGQIMEIENFIKTNYAVRQDLQGPDAENLEKVLKNRMGSEKGIMKLFLAMFQEKNIKFQILLTGHRITGTLDPEFENWNLADNFLIYFPNQEQFIAPTEVHTRYPFFPPYFGEANALYCKTTTLGNFTSAVGEIKPVPLHPYKDNQSNITSKVKFNASLDTLLIDYTQAISGHESINIRPVFTYMKKEDQEKTIKEMIKFGTRSDHFVSYAANNTELKDQNQNKPLVFNGVTKTTELLEKAGSKLLLKVGELIGQQVEMYEDKERQFEIELPYAHEFNRDLTIEIPAGYTVRNLKELEINRTMSTDGEESAGFQSTYKLNGQVLKITVYEFYKRVKYPKSQIEEFRRVINSAADFNKITLVLEKS